MIRTLARLFFLCAAASIVLSCAAGLKSHKEFYVDQQPREEWAEARDSAGSYVREGKFISWHENGAEKVTGEFHLGLKNGLWTTKDPDGRVTEWSEYQDGVQHGLAVSYHPNRKKQQEGKYVKGRRDGIWRQWYSDGGLKEEGVYVDGRQEGIWTSWYPGFKKRSEIEYKDGQMNGPFLTWRESGLRWEEGSYQGGLKSGVWTTWDEMGLVFSKETYIAGKQVAAGSSASAH